MKKYLLILIGIVLLMIPNGCSKMGVVEDPYIDPHIIFTSRRWWNYDIFITDIYGGHMTHLTKNKWLDFNPAVSPDGSKLAFVSVPPRENDIKLSVVVAVTTRVSVSSGRRDLRSITSASTPFSANLFPASSAIWAMRE